MISGIIGKKLGMTQLYKADGNVEAVTAIEAGPCTVVQVKTEAKEGYNAARLGFGQPRVTKGSKKELKGTSRFKYLREVRLDDTKGIEIGQKVDVSLFKAGDKIDVIGISKGKGFAGGVKRYHFKGGPKTHGQSDRHRAPGSMGPDIPDRVLKGQRMAGHMGDAQVTVRRLSVSESDPARNLLMVKGAVPGGKNALVLIRKSAKRK